MPQVTGSCRWPGDFVVEIPQGWSPVLPIASPNDARHVSPVWDAVDALKRKRCTDDANKTNFHAMLEEEPSIRQYFFLKDRLDLDPAQ
eukprot:gnl/TRDRNA2_/TRDRNA2_79094_c3_seq1.p1 gnl/TRDRNA2_/TRDRNA2_79094_c3~~gnl/TRDRNA2_/TRDRNA2_79094_c3_seq1.p1  ORF type:complete len:103 (-),score=6.51 gnl/TRDRNA2_/TRDRNA2_79094_c3_seq1:23-286(-)